jgi:uncharacterized membrane protein
MADLIAIGYPDETTALSAMDETERLQHELIIQADAVAAIVRNKQGKIRVEALSKYGGTVLKSSLSNEAQQQELQDALHGEGASQ